MRGAWAVLTTVVLAVLLVGAIPARGGSILGGPGEFDAAAVTIDFGGWATGTSITNQYPGLLFSSVNGLADPRIDINEIGGGLGLNGGPADPTIYTHSAGDAPVLLTFTGGAAAAVGLNYIDSVTYIGQGFFYDVDGNLLHRFYLDQDSDFWGYRIGPGEKPIGSVLIDSAGGYPELTFFGPDTADTYTIDNLIYEPVPSGEIPEPGTLVLLVLGAGTVLLRRPRR